MQEAISLDPRLATVSGHKNFDAMSEPVLGMQKLQVQSFLL